MNSEIEFEFSETELRFLKYNCEFQYSIENSEIQLVFSETELPFLKYNCDF